jgi:hydroxyacylglutathione hydrolase
MTDNARARRGHLDAAPDWVIPVPAFDDNYIWLVDNGDGSAFVVDPGDPAPVNAALSARGLRLETILITHHHFDHVGGLAALKEQHGCHVFGPANPAIAGIDTTLGHGDRLHVGGREFSVLAVPGHTLDHIAFFCRDATPPLLFCGDTLFAGGCGRLFEGTPEVMHESLDRLAALPAETLVYCAHEYTLANLAFARAADPDNEALAARQRAAAELREAGIPTVPSTIGLEQATNPFLRSREASVQHTLRAAGRNAADPVSAFASLRSWKDSF